jgi:hypothetical protein
MKVDPAIFKAYDIRGIYGENLDEKVANAIGKSVCGNLKTYNCYCGARWTHFRAFTNASCIRRTYKRCWRQCRLMLGKFLRICIITPAPLKNCPELW